MPILASAGDYTLLLSDPRPTQKAEVLSLSPHALGKEVEAVGISPDGSLLVSGCRDGLLVFVTLSIPSLRPQLHDNSVSAKLRNSRAILEQSFNHDSVEDLTEATSQASTSEGDLSTAVSRENMLLETGRLSPLGISQHSTLKGQTHFKTSQEQRGVTRQSRQRRAEKKVVDLPTMIAHLSASVRSSMLEEQLSSSDSEDDITSEEQDPQKKIGALIGVAQKVNKYSEITNKTSVQEMLHKVPEQRLSLLPKDAPETIRENRKFFEGQETFEGIDGIHGGDGGDKTRGIHLETEYYGYATLLPGQDESDTDTETGSSLQQSGNYSLGNSLQTEDFHSGLGNRDSDRFTSPHSSKQHSFDEYYDDDVPFSMI